VKKSLKAIFFILLFFSMTSCTEEKSITIVFQTNGGNEIEDMIVGANTDSLDLPIPIKEGYTFVGWYNDDELSNAYTSKLLPPIDITLYAKWIINQYTITFEENEGSNVLDITQEYLSALSIPDDPIKTGYTFTGWYSDELLTMAYTFNTVPLGGITLYAKWIINEYIISFEENGGSVVTNLTQDYLTLVNEPTNSTKEGYTFAGWYSDELLTTAYAFDIMPAQNLILYAKWTINEYTISFEENDGSIVPDITQAFLTTVPIPDDSIKTGYTFAGWYSDELLTSIYTFDTMPAQSLILYAKWTINEYTISFEENDGSAVPDITQAFLSAVSVPNDAIKAGYSFDGWYSDNEFTTVYIFTTMPLDGITLYAKWVINEYTISFEENGGSSVDSITQNYLTTVMTPINPIKTDYLFGGWYSNIELTTAYIFTTMPSENVVLYAKWDVILNSITFVDFIDDNDIVPSLQLAAGEIIILPVPNLVEGYEFLGWFVDAELTIIFENTIMPNADFTLYGDWGLNTYIMAYETNGGTAFDSVEVTYKAQIPDPGLPIKEDYLFGGWYIDTDFTFPYEFLDMPASNMTVYAKWVFEELFYPIELMFINQPITPITVQGIIYYVFPDPLNGFYLYDGTGYIFVSHSSSGLTVGQGVQITSSFELFENKPQLINVTEITSDESFSTMPFVSEMSLEYLIQITETEHEIYGMPVMVTGVLGNSGSDYYLIVMDSNDVVIINNQSYLVDDNPFEFLIGQTLIIYAIIYDYDSVENEWHILFDPSFVIEHS